jgi:pimeloyl-ACP methyl ester carboxylesterase
MAKYYLVFASLFFCTAHAASAATHISQYDHITEDTTWTAAASPYILPSYFQISSGATLTLEPGTTVQTSGVIFVAGTLNTNGTEELPVSLSDQYGEWLAISVAGTANLKHTTLKHAGGYTGTRGNITSIGGNISIEDVTFEESIGGPLVNLRNATFTAERSVFQDSEEGILTNGSSNVTVHNSIFQNISNYSIYHFIPIGVEPYQVDASNNYWNDPLGPEKITRVRPGSMLVSNYVTTDPFLVAEPGSGCQTDCFSNVLFLPGIMGSRLYGTDGATEEELWFSSLSARQEGMEMNADGTSKNDLYTKEVGGVLGETYGLNLYQSFLGDLSTWKTEGVYNDYAVIPYDWRVSLEDVVMNGKLDNGQLRYTTDNSDLEQSYVYQKLKALQASSKSGKVTLIGHSNGGLVIKALVQKLKDTNDPLYNQIDKVILVAVPQTGTPDTVVSLLYGSKLGVLWTGVSAKMTRLLGHNMPTMYNLLPSAKLFSQISAPITFIGNNVDPSWTSRYGNSINTYQEFEEFLTGQEGRSRPDFADTLNPEVLSGSMFSNAKAAHSVLDNWAPASNTQVIQIAGWGMYTVAGLQIDDDKECEFELSQLIDGRPVCTSKKVTTTLRDKKVLGGDETVLTQSALDMPAGSNVKNYWVDLATYNSVEEIAFVTHRKHRNILEVDQLRPFIKSLLRDTISNQEYISDFEPAPLNRAYAKYEIHSPLYLTVTDDQGNKTGWDASLGRIVENIKGAQYSEIGEIKTVLVPKNTPHTATLEAYSKGSFTLDITELSGEAVVSETKFEAIPALVGTVAEVTSTTAGQSVAMTLDFNNDGTAETELQAVPGSEVEYQNPVAVDIVAPELSVTFDQIARDIVWTAIDDQDPNPVVEVTQAKVMATDSAGNKTEIPFIKYREGKTRLKVQFEKVITNGEEFNIDKTTLIYDWQLKKGILTDLDTDLRVKEKSRLKIEYRKFKNETKIIEKDKQEKTKKVTTRPGFVSLSVSTSNKNIIWEY